MKYLLLLLFISCSRYAKHAEIVEKNFQACVKQWNDFTDSVNNGLIDVSQPYARQRLNYLYEINKQALIQKLEIKRLNK